MTRRGSRKNTAYSLTSSLKVFDEEAEDADEEEDEEEEDDDEEEELEKSDVDIDDPTCLVDNAEKRPLLLFPPFLDVELPLLPAA